MGEVSTIRVRQRAPKYPQNGNFCCLFWYNRTCQGGDRQSSSLPTAQNRLDKPPVARTRAGCVALPWDRFGDGHRTGRSSSVSPVNDPEAQCSTRVGLQANKHLQSGTCGRQAPRGVSRLAHDWRPPFCMRALRIESARVAFLLTCPAPTPWGADHAPVRATSTSCCQMSTKAQDRARARLRPGHEPRGRARRLSRGERARGDQRPDRA